MRERNPDSPRKHVNIKPGIEVPEPSDGSEPDHGAKHSSEQTETVPSGHGPEGAGADKDVVSDPAQDDRVGSDWADEGGAVEQGPATATELDPSSAARARGSMVDYGVAGSTRDILDSPD